MMCRFTKSTGEAKEKNGWRLVNTEQGLGSGYVEHKDQGGRWQAVSHPPG